MLGSLFIVLPNSRHSSNYLKLLQTSEGNGTLLVLGPTCFVLNELTWLPPSGLVISSNSHQHGSKPSGLVISNNSHYYRFTRLCGESTSHPYKAIIRNHSIWSQTLVNNQYPQYKFADLTSKYVTSEKN